MEAKHPDAPEERRKLLVVTSVRSNSGTLQSLSHISMFLSKY